MQMEQDKDDIMECNLPYDWQFWGLRPIVWVGIVCVAIVILFFVTYVGSAVFSKLREHAGKYKFTSTKISLPSLPILGITKK